MAMYVARSLAASFMGQSSPRGAGEEGDEELSGLAPEVPSGRAPEVPSGGAPLWASAAPPGRRQAIATKVHGLTLRIDDLLRRSPKRRACRLARCAGAAQRW